MTSPTLFVSGASGHLGRLVIAALQSRGYDGKIIAGTRDPSKLADLKGVEVRKADFTDKAGLVTALAGADKLLIISTDQIGTRLAGHLVAIEAAKAAGIKEIAYTSMPNPEAPSPITFAPEHFGTEEAIKASGIPYTILRMNWYAHNLLGSLPNALASGQWYTSVGDGKVNYVTREDCARAAAGALLKTASNQTYTVTGPAALSAAEIAALVSAAARQAAGGGRRHRRAARRWRKGRRRPGFRHRALHRGVRPKYPRGPGGCDHRCGGNALGHEARFGRRVLQGQCRSAERSSGCGGGCALRTKGKAPIAPPLHLSLGG